MDAKKSRIRHIAKTITWRIIASLTTFILAFIFTKNLEKSLWLMGIEMVLKLLLYYYHERAWFKYSNLGRDEE
ncbi:MAG: DUF2061 domain-containing protein [Bacteroidetes bacterium]|jgi:uncharacterized membrane protein|nr:DUF2061 domain-containing protein [Bacteroidota bacterium]MDA0568732.1 DUF2061 domain-containing protein [Bacteroidota bacterium]